MKRTILATLLAAGTLVSAQSFAAYGDENDTSWLPKANTAAQTQRASGDRAVALPKGQIIHYGDENTTSWLPTPARR